MLCDSVFGLYVSPKGPYPGLLKHWCSPHAIPQLPDGVPVVAHPPPTGRNGLHIDNAQRAVQCVWRLGGALVHPARSWLWRRHPMLARPWEHIDNFGSLAYETDLVRWGHPCRKPVWIYTHGISPRQFYAHVPPDRLPEYRRRGQRHDLSLPVLPSKLGKQPPRAFAEWLVELVRRSCGQ